MAYYLGRDVNVYLMTESVTASKNISVSGNASAGPYLTVGQTPTADNILDFATDMEPGAALTNYTAEADITGVDVSLASQDEDTSYIGQTQVGKAIIKRNYTITITRKKKNSVWDVVWNGDVNGNVGRFGLANAEAAPSGTGLTNPKEQVNATYDTKSCYGYRLTLQLKTGTAGPAANEETIVFTNCCVQSYSATLNADGVTEETMELMTYQPARYAVPANATILTLTNLTDF